MAGSWPKIIRDPIHNIITFHDEPWDRLLLRLLDCREVQRLRRIKQLGFSELTFPGANHNRFAHSIGVLHVAKKFLDQFDRVTGKALDADQRTFVLAACLLHDIGHGPFSHAFEKVTGRPHEAYTRDIIRDPGTEVYQALAGHDPQMPDRLANFFDEETESSGSGLPLYLTHLISSQFDADRCDYLLRDSYATGTDYGRYDLEWLLAHTVPDDKNRRFYLTRKALSATEAYVYARFHMYRTVYFHKTTRAAEVMLKLLFKRVEELLKPDHSPGAFRQVLPYAPSSFLAAFTGQMSLTCYLTLDDHTVTEFLKSCTRSSDAIVQSLGSGILDRKLYKAIDLSGRKHAEAEPFLGAVRNILPPDPVPDYLFALDTPADTAYKPYDPDSDKPETQIYIENAAGVPQEIGLISETVQQLRRQYELVRYYYPDNLREKIKPIAAEKL